MRSTLDKNQPLLRFLFDGFTVGHKYPPPKGIAVNEKVIRIAELMKLYREHNINGAMLSKSEYETLISLINDKLLKPYDEEALNFTGFVQFFWQSAIYCHEMNKLKAPHDTGGKYLSQLIYGDMIENLVKWFKLAAVARNFSNIDAYEYPELANNLPKARQLHELNEQA